LNYEDTDYGKGALESGWNTRLLDAAFKKSLTDTKTKKIFGHWLNGTVKSTYGKYLFYTDPILIKDRNKYAKQDVNKIAYYSFEKMLDK